MATSAKADPLPKFLQFDYPPQQLCICGRRSLSAFRNAGLLFHRYTLILGKAEGW